MLRKTRLGRPSPGTVLGGLALVVAMSGVAVAAIPGGNGNVSTCIGVGGVLRAIDTEAGETCAKREEAGPTLATPASTVANANRLGGTDASAYVKKVVTRYGPERTFSGSGGAFSYAACAAGEKVVGGGHQNQISRSSAIDDSAVDINRPSRAVEDPEGVIRHFAPGDGTEEATGWFIGINTNGETPVTFRAYVQCAS